MREVPPTRLTRLERDYASGVPVRVILDTFRPTGIRLSEATFRKYVQNGLLPRSRRVGEKGKHRGSRGLYPVAALRQVQAIKRMLAEGKTLEDIRSSIVVFQHRLESVERMIHELLDSFATELTGRSFGHAQRRRFRGQITTLRRRTRALVSDAEALAAAITARPVRP